MTLAIDSLVTDLIFQAGDALDPEVLVEALGGQDVLATKQVVDPDMQDPRFEMELSPSMPFRRRGERRLMVIDDSVAPMREDPRAESVIALDLRPAKAHLLSVCGATPVRFGRLFALGSWGDAVWIARSFRDLRAICLLSWVLDPSMDIEGRRRATPLSQSEFEEKLLAYDPRLEELDDDELRLLVGDANLEETEDFIIVDVLEEDGSWDVKKSIALESKLAAIERFSTFVGAKSVKSVAPTPEAAPEEPTAKAEEAAPPEPPAVVVPLRTAECSESILLIFPAERFDLDVAAALGKKDWDSILCASDNIGGADKDRIYRTGADFVAPVEFFSEVFLEGKPLGKAEFDAAASTDKDGVKTMEVHFPRFGPVLLLTHPDGSRFVSSVLSNSSEDHRSVLEAIGH